MDSENTHSNEKTDLEILKILSMNGRATLDFVGKRVDLTKHPTYRRIKTLEEKYGIRYISEIDASKFGYLGYLAFVKFKDKMPSLEELHKVFDKEPHVQLALLTTGKYDMMIYFLSDSHRNVAYFIYELQTYTIFANYKAYWYVVPNFASQFALPLRDEYIELLSKKVWHKTKEKKKPDQSELTEIEFNTLKELNKNGGANFTDIDKKYNQSIGASRYAYLKLIDRGILKRITITLDKLPIKYNVIFFAKEFYGKAFSKTRPNILTDIIKDGPVINKYTYAGDIGLPAGAMLVMPVLTDSQVKETEDYFEKNVKGISVSKLVITNILTGAFIYRRFDNAHTNQYRLLVEEYKLIKAEERVEYNTLPKRREKSDTIFM